MQNTRANLKGRLRLLPAGNSGIGLATAKQFVNEGAYVFITGRREAELAAAKQIGKNVTAIQGDVGIEAQKDGVAPQLSEDELRRRVQEQQWMPAYGH
jgi:short-subunit dehydrogenase involved in D-alanine esterification of teichoic acids